MPSTTLRLVALAAALLPLGCLGRERQQQQRLELDKQHGELQKLELELEETGLNLASRLAEPAIDRHPFWELQWSEAQKAETAYCGVVLLLAALLCSAGGIGGGGVYVSVLMVIGRLSPRDAVPLSKAVVFMGSIASLVLNLGKSMAGSKGGKASGVINYSICRIVVPAALLGTLMGVVVNRNAPDASIVLMLTTVLLGMSAMAIWTTYTQFLEEEGEAGARLLQQAAARADVARPPAGPPGTDSEAGKEAAFEGDCAGSAAKKEESSQNVLKISDVCISLSVLLAVVANGVVRHHASACLWELENGSNLTARQVACEHPTLHVFIGKQLETWMADPMGASWAMILTLSIPITICSAVLAYYSWVCVSKEQWPPLLVAKYELMALLTGCLAGLIGIGGGLIFSPFFLFMGVEPAMAVATSSTCVIFTSSSTTMQYLFTDRVVMSLALVYGLVNLVGSYCGTAFVHHLQDKFATRRSYISAIVTLGVLLSAVFSLSKLMHPAQQA